MPGTLIEMLTCPACLLDAAGNATHINAAWLELSGAAGRVGQSVSWTQLIAPGDRYLALSQFRSAALGGERREFQCRLQSEEAGARWFVLSLQPLNDEAVGEALWLCMGTDVHEMKLREAELERRASIQTDMLNISVDCIKLIALDGTVIHMNKAGCQSLGVPEDSGFGMPWLPLLPEDVWPEGQRALEEARAGRFARFPGKSALPGQKVQHWDNMLTPVLGAQERPTAILCVSREVTAERETSEALRESQERLSIAARVGGLGIWDYEIRRDKLHCDHAWYRIMGRDPSRPITSIAEFRPFIHADDVERATEVVQTAGELIASERDYTIVFRIIRPNGDIRWVRSAAWLDHLSGTPTRAVGYVVDITDAWCAELALREANHLLEEEKAQLSRQSLEDPLTGIANRRYLDRELARICVRSALENEVVCICLIDVDHFKLYNDRYGHIEGDTALRKIASALQSVTRFSDLAARYGGEEFALVLTDTADPSPVLERFASTIAELGIPHEGSPTGCLTVSCGCIVVSAGANLSPQLLLEASDRVLYEAKVAGRNRCIIAPLHFNV